MIKRIFISITSLVLFIIPVYAHPGRTDGSGCHTCKSNCSRWGLYDGEYHCHSGNNYTNSYGQIFNSDGTLVSSEPTITEPISETPEYMEPSTEEPEKNTDENNEKIVQEKVPSDDNTLKSIKINRENIKVEDNITYRGDYEDISIVVETNDKNATYKIESGKTDNGVKPYHIFVTSESGKEKVYTISLFLNNYEDSSELRTTKSDSIKTEDNENNSLTTATGIAILAGGYGLYRKIKKK